MEILRFPQSFPPNESMARLWERLLQTFSVSSPMSNSSMYKFRTGSLLLEVGQPPDWKPFEVVLAGSSTTDLGLYYYPQKPSPTPLGCIRLQRAHIDCLEDVVMVVTNDKTWFLGANTVRDATLWTDAICNAMKRLNAMQTRQHHLLELSTFSLGDQQARGSNTRVDEFLQLFVHSPKEDLCFKAVKGALSLSCMRSLAWKVWLNYLPETLPFQHWVSHAREKRRGYERKRGQHRLFQNLLCGKQNSEEFLTMCETSTNNLLYNISKDVCRTRGELRFFRDPFVQCVMIRVLYVYSVAYWEISYNQGMGELLATILYLLYIEQWPLVEDASTEIAAKDDAESNGRFVSDTSFFRAGQKHAEDTYNDDCSSCSVESRSKNQQGDTTFTRNRFLQSRPFSAEALNAFQECCRDATGAIVRELTMSEFIEHDAYLLLEEMMGRMAGTYCSHVPLSHRSLQPQVDKPLSSADQLPVSPLDHQMNRVHHHILSRCDPRTAKHLANLGVEPQMFLLRWIRVLMAREFEMSQVWQIWDAIFSLTPSDFSFINVLCVAIVQDFRDEILAADDATTVLLCLRNVSDRIDVSWLVDNARELYDALLIATAIEASISPAKVSTT